MPRPPHRRANTKRRAPLSRDRGFAGDQVTNRPPSLKQRHDLHARRRAGVVTPNFSARSAALSGEASFAGVVLRATPQKRRLESAAICRAPSRLAPGVAKAMPQGEMRAAADGRFALRYPPACAVAFGRSRRARWRHKKRRSARAARRAARRAERASVDAFARIGLGAAVVAVRVGNRCAIGNSVR